MREQIDAPLPPSETEAYPANLEQGRAALGKAAYDAAWNEGRALSHVEATACALNVG